MTSAHPIAASATVDRARAGTSARGDHRANARFSPRSDLIVAAAFAALAVALLSRQWAQPRATILTLSGQDQTLWEWFFAASAHAVTALENPFFSTLQNAPSGVNMMANTAMLGLALPMTPITLAFGPAVSFVAAITAGVAATAYGWYHLFSRVAVTSRSAAALGGLICGFAPGMVSHANAHPNFVFLVALPLLALAAVRIAQGRAVVRNAVVAGLLAAWQVFLGEEPLLIGALAGALFTAAYLVMAPRALLVVLPRLIPAAVGAAALAGALVAWPVWLQFHGPESYSYLDHELPGNDLLAITSFPPTALGGAWFPGPDLSINGTEQNAYLGWPLLVVTAACTVYLWRSAAARAAAVTAAVMIVLSLGAVLTIGGADTAVELPGKTVHTYPLIESILETRMVLAAVPAMALIIALAADRVIATRSQGRLLSFAAAVAIALIPLVPTPLPVSDRGPIPTFFTDGAWRNYVDDGSVVVVPVPNPSEADALRWQYESGSQFRLAGGYFVGPSDDDPRVARYGARNRETALLLGSVRNTGIAVTATAEQKAAAMNDLAFWKADVVVLPPGKNAAALRRTIDDLLGMSGVLVDGSTVWDVRGLVRE